VASDDEDDDDDDDEGGGACLWLYRAHDNDNDAVVEDSLL
jgi:hypothetical protein